MADKSLHVELVVDLADQFRGLIDDGHIILLAAGQIARDVKTDEAAARR